MKVVEAVTGAWQDLQRLVEADPDIPFDHEFSFQFHLTWGVARLFNFAQDLNVRFEVPCGKDADGETIRPDLLLWKDPTAKVAVELKAPLRSEDGSNSAMTQFRMRFYRDIHRLRYLVESHHRGICTGVFLAVVNEKGYVLERNQRVNAEYRTYHGVRVPPAAGIPATQGPNGYPHEMRMPRHEITWSWGCQPSARGVELLPGMKHFWLEPIIVREA